MSGYSYPVEELSKLAVAEEFTVGTRRIPRATTVTEQCQSLRDNMWAGEECGKTVRAKQHLVKQFRPLSATRRHGGRTQAAKPQNGNRHSAVGIRRSAKAATAKANELRGGRAWHCARVTRVLKVFLRKKRALPPICHQQQFRQDLS